MQVLYFAQEVKGVSLMNEAAKEARRAYRRQWAKDHPENVKRWQENYWNKKAAEAAEKAASNEGGATNDK